MPYLPPKTKEYLEAGGPVESPGDLNFKIALLVKQYMMMNGGLSYTNINNAIGALECCKLELYRRIAAPYEDIKIKENGDVF